MAVAIDFGNENTVVSYNVGRREHILNDEDSKLIPSYFQYNDEGELVQFGQLAKNALRDGSQNIVAGIKRLIGVSYGQKAYNMAWRLYGLNIKELNGGRIAIEVGPNLKTPEAIAIDFFTRLHQMVIEGAEAQTGLFRRLMGGADIDHCVLTCPAGYSHSQTTALQQCICKAGFHLINIKQKEKEGLLPEPIAAGELIAVNEGGTLVIDWGGGTLDFALIDASRQCVWLNACQQGCGGIDMDVALFENLQETRHLPKDLSGIERAQVRAYIEQLKEALLSLPVGTDLEKKQAVRIPLQTEEEPIAITLSLGQVLKWIGPVLQKARDGIRNVLRQIEGKATACVLVGGPVRSSHIEACVRDVVGKLRITTLPDPMTAVSRGALKYAITPVPQHAGRRTILPHDYGVMVDQVGHYVGVVLLRSQALCPADSGDPRELELRGFPGQMVNLAVFARKANVGEESHQYESSADFTILPTFDKNNIAKVKVRLEADASGVITAHVTDAATNQRLNLNSVSQAISRRICGPPCRSFLETAGLILRNCWNRYSLQQLLSGNFHHLLLGRDAAQPTPPDDEREMNDFIQKYLAPEPYTLAQAWQDVQQVASELLAAAAQCGPIHTDMSKRAKRIEEQVNQSKPNTTRQLIEDLLRDFDDLATAIVRAIGSAKVVPALQNLPLVAKNQSIAVKVRALTDIISRFSPNAYDRLFNTWNEIKNELINANCADAIEIFEPIDRVARLRETTKRIENWIRNR